MKASELEPFLVGRNVLFVEERAYRTTLRESWGTINQADVIVIYRVERPNDFDIIKNRFGRITFLIDRRTSLGPPHKNTP